MIEGNKISLKEKPECLYLNHLIESQLQTIHVFKIHKSFKNQIQFGMA